MSNVFPVSLSEYELRWRRVQLAAKELGLGGAVVWSRGGAPLDAYGDVYYLANHYTLLPFTPDYEPHWAGRSHAALVMPVDGEPILIVDIPDVRSELISVPTVRFSMNLPAETARVVRAAGLAAAPIGLVGANAMTASTYLAFCEALPSVDLRRVDALVEDIRVVKSERERELLRESSAAGGRVMDAIVRAARKPGATEASAVAHGVSTAAAEGVAIYDVATASGPFTDRFAHGRLPSWTQRRLERGDIFHVDCYGARLGYQFDLARSLVVGANPSPEQRAVLDGTIAAVETGLETVRPEVDAGRVFNAVHRELEDRGLTPRTPLDAEHGHSQGVAWEPPWIIPNEMRAFESGMCICVEAMGGVPEVGAAYFEQSIILAEDGNELITTSQKRWW